MEGLERKIPWLGMLATLVLPIPNTTLSGSPLSVNSSPRHSDSLSWSLRAVATWARTYTLAYKHPYN